LPTTFVACLEKCSKEMYLRIVIILNGVSDKSGLHLD
jgi:hypothetical protein